MAKRNITKKQFADYKVAWHEHNKDCRRRYLHDFQFKTLNEYIAYVRGEKYVSMPVAKAAKAVKVEEKRNEIPSHAASVGNCFKAEPKVYSGERKLVGIAVMHKSNLVPIFEDEEGDSRQEATEIANMSK